jgi:Carboxypeptidase regulatory-like domain
MRALATALLILALHAAAQENAESPSRAVQGLVSDRNGHPVQGAVVEIENTRTLTVRSFITERDGKYHFQELNTDTDYRIRAMLDGVFGPPKSLSRFQSRKEATVNLKIGL